jgi:lipopolysaccharide/colanic/teichoic acid biosynthesis glycosyltransferase
MSTAEFRHDFFSENSLFGASSDSAATPSASGSLVWKTIFDRSLALVLLMPALPLIVLLVVVVRLTSRGPGLYRQERVGKGCRRFLMYKIRSMRVDAEVRTGPVWALAGCDPRITAVGYWLRRSHLDELPQLFNVLRGEMSLVGPRPERPEFVAVLTDAIPGYLDRLQVLPGITGLAQVNLPADCDVDSVQRKLVLDREYLARANFWLDVRILLCTLLRVIGLRTGRAIQFFGLQRTVTHSSRRQPTDCNATCGPTPHTICATELGKCTEPMSERCAGPMPHNGGDLLTADAAGMTSRINRDRKTVCAD